MWSLSMRHAMYRVRQSCRCRSARPNMRTLIALLVEPTMYFAIGFLLAGLASLPAVAAIHRRAVRLTKERMNSLVPLSVQELQAEKDLLRAEFAVSTQRLESTLDGIKAK